MNAAVRQGTELAPEITHHPGGLCLGIKLVDRRDEFPRVGEIEIMGPRGNCGACDAVILRLEWPSGMDDQVRTNFRIRDSTSASMSNAQPAAGLIAASAAAKASALGFDRPAIRSETLGIVGQRFRRYSFRNSVATNDQDTLHQFGLATISQKTTTNPVKAGQPRTKAFLSRS